MKKQTFAAHSAEETRALGAQLARSFKGGQIILLDGNLGAGKTHFAQGVARGLGIKKNITSPTFTIMNIYATRSTRANMKKIDKNTARIFSRAAPITPHSIARLAHIDLYRVKTVDEIYAVGVMDYAGEPRTLTLIEWPEKIKNALPKKCERVRVAIKTTGATNRLISVSLTGFRRCPADRRQTQNKLVTAN